MKGIRMGYFRLLSAFALTAVWLTGCAEKSDTSSDAQPTAPLTTQPATTEVAPDAYKLKYFAFSVSDELTKNWDFKSDYDDDQSYGFEDNNSSVSLHIKDDDCRETVEFCAEHRLTLYESNNFTNLGTSYSELNGFPCTTFDLAYKDKFIEKYLFLHCEGNHIEIRAKYENPEDEKRADELLQEVAESVVYYSGYHIPDTDMVYSGEHFEVTYSPKWRYIEAPSDIYPDVEFLYNTADNDRQLFTSLFFTGCRGEYSSLSEWNDKTYKQISENINYQNIEVSEEEICGRTATVFSYIRNGNSLLYGESVQEVNKYYHFEINGELYALNYSYCTDYPDDLKDIEQLLSSIKIK